MTRRPRHAEIWHWTWLDRRWGGPLAWWQAWDQAVVPVGGSDFHRPRLRRAARSAHHLGRVQTIPSGRR